MATAKKKQDVAATELAEKLVRKLETLRASAPAEYPLALDRLVERTDPQAGDRLISAALRQKAFADRVLLAKGVSGAFPLKKARLAPVALVEDADLLASSAITLAFVLQGKRSDSNQAWGISDLAKWLGSKLQESFRRALRRQIDEDSLPPGVCYVKISRTEKIFSTDDLRPASARPQTAASPIAMKPPAAAPSMPATEPPSTVAPVEANGDDFAEQFTEAFDRLDHQRGSHNLVSLVDLRQALVRFSRAQFDAGLRALRLEGRFGLSAAEGLHGIRPEDRQAGIEETGVLLLHVSRKSP